MRPSRLLPPLLSCGLLLPLLLTSCGGPHVLAGNWTEVRADGTEGVRISFDESGGKIIVHGAPRPEGGHDHPKATFTFDGATKALTIECPLLGGGKATTWKGTLHGDAFDLASGDEKLTFQRGGQGDGH